MTKTFKCRATSYKTCKSHSDSIKISSPSAFLVLLLKTIPTHTKVKCFLKFPSDLDKKGKALQFTEKNSRVGCSLFLDLKHTFATEGSTAKHLIKIPEVSIIYSTCIFQKLGSTSRLCIYISILDFRVLDLSFTSPECL